MAPYDHWLFPKFKSTLKKQTFAFAKNTQKNMQLVMFAAQKAGTVHYGSIWVSD